MSLVAKWALQFVAVVMLGWIALMAGSWSNGIVNGDRSDRLAQLSEATAQRVVLAGRGE